MGLACTVRGHKWNKLPDGRDGCTCTRCGERRDEGHDWHFTFEREDWAGGSRKVIRGQFNVCSVCNRWELARSKQELCEHDWNGCKCKLCSLTRDEGHEWNGCKCKRCGKTRDEGHSWQGNKCSICGKNREQGCRALKENGRHAFKQQKKCRRRCAECGYTMTWHEFRNGTCMTCGVDESDYYAKLIMSGKAKYEDKDDGGSGRQTNGAHIKSVTALRSIALSEKKELPYEAKRDCAQKLRDIAVAGGADAHEANVALHDIVLAPVLFWDTPEIAGWITEPELASDPALVEFVQETRKNISDYANAMVASDSGLYTTG